MTHLSTNAGSAEVTVVEIHGRWPLLFLIGSGLAWLVLSGVFALIAALQLHTPSFLADCPWLTHGRVQALRESAFIYGWAANAGLAVALWVLGRLGGYALRALNWVIVGTIFWNLGVTGGLVGIAVGDLTSFQLLQLPRYVQPLLVVAWGAIAVAGVLAWNGRRTDSTFASQWYAAAALFLFPWLLCAAQVVLLWSPVRGTVQAVASGWFTQSAFTLWLAPLALAGAYYVVPKVSGRVMPSYDFAPLGFWTLIFVGSWTGGRHLVGGPVPAWIPTIAVVACSLVLFHHLVLFLNLRTGLGARGPAMGFIRFGVIAYILVGVVDAIVSFRGIAERTQFTFVSTAVENLGLYGGISMMLFGTIYYMLPRLTGKPWASGGLIAGHRVLTKAGVILLVVTLVVAGWRQGAALLDPKVAFSVIAESLRTPMLVTVVAHGVLLLASLLFFVNFVRSACTRSVAEPTTVFRQPSTLEAHV